MRFHRRYRWLLVILWACFILYMSSHSTPPGDPIGRTTQILHNIGVTPPLVPGKSLAFTIGKVGHVLEYGFLGVLLFAAAWGPLQRRLSAVIGLGLLIAIADETRQYFVPGREGCEIGRAHV